MIPDGSENDSLRRARWKPAGTLGIFAAAMTFIPNLGPMLSVVPPALLGFASSPKQGLLVLLLFGAVHFVEGFLLTPIAERTVVHLAPALTLSAQLLLAVVGGPVGVALAAPITIVTIVLIRTLYIEDRFSLKFLSDQTQH